MDVTRPLLSNYTFLQHWIALIDTFAARCSEMGPIADKSWTYRFFRNLFRLIVTSEPIEGANDQLFRCHNFQLVYCE